MSRRPPNELESRLHQAALVTPHKEITAKQAEVIIPDATARQDALNFLLGVGLFKLLKDSKGNSSFRAVSKGELVATRDLSGEENLVLSHIKVSGNEGIWTKHLKTKTNLHQTVIDRCLKTLTQKRLIKRVPSVQHKTRKIYMLEGLEPSIVLTGGPWYTDNELDTEFIRHLSEACLKFIQDLTFPKRREGTLYPISNAPRYPTAQHIRNSLRKARLTETDLSVEHVEMLLNVLVLDGKIEKLPAFSTIGDDESEEEGMTRSRKKREHDDRALESKHRRKRVKVESGDSSKEEEEEQKSSPKKSRKRRAKDISDTQSDPESDIENKRKKARKQKKRSHSDEDDLSTDDEEEKNSSRKKKKSRRKKRKHDTSDSSSETESDSEPHLNRRSQTSKQSSSPTKSSGIDAFDIDYNAGHVYRAIRDEKLLVGWWESPCSVCPSFEICKDGGPVNPQQCVYYEEWLATGTVKNVD